MPLGLHQGGIRRWILFLCLLPASCGVLCGRQSLTDGARPFPGLTDIQEVISSGTGSVAAHISAPAAAAAAAAASAPSTAHPANVTGTFRGEWIWEAMSPAVAAQMPVFEQEQGVVILQLNSSGGSHEGVHHVEGEMMLRDGPYMGETDTLMRLRGVYLPASGRMHAVLEPRHPLELPFAAHEANSASPHFRQALREAAQQLAAESDEITSRAEEVRRGLGLDTRPLEAQLAGESPGSSGGGRAAALSSQLALARVCSFMLDVTVGMPSGVNGAELAGPQQEDEWREPQQQPLLPAAVVGDTDALVAGIDDGRAWGRELEATDFTLSGTLAAANCGIRVRLNATNTHIEKYYRKAVNYTLMITSVSFFQVVLLIRQMEATATTATAARLSMWCIAQQAIMDAYLCLLHLTTGIMVEPLFNAFATAAFFEFVIFAIFEMRWLLMAWRARRGSQDGWQQQRELSLMYARFYGALLTGILLTYQLQKYMKWVLFVLYGWWLPQIFLSAVSDARQPLKPAYVLGTSVARLALPLYLYGCPANLLHIPPAPGMLAALVTFVAAQVAVLVAQHLRGPRCFVPRCLLPPKYDYFRLAPPSILPGAKADSAGTSGSGGSAPPSPRDEETGHGSVECVICMNPVQVAQASARMLTPCNHFFHTKCLQRWMDVKMECPTCRSKLPPP